LEIKIFKFLKKTFAGSEKVATFVIPNESEGLASAARLVFLAPKLKVH
jgi:hypothetical protein